MITALDTNVLFDVLWIDPQFARLSARSLLRCATEGRLVACEVVWAELSATFPSHSAFSSAMDSLGVAFSPIDAAAAVAAGEIWRDYRSRRGSRLRLLPDFVVAGHALHQADRLLTRDRGFYRSYFPELTILDPTAD
ncbi:MAG: DNA-binding protein [Anaerolinea sp.]|nr:DNA-binding protein [Anaerolinea sp.]